MGFAVDELKIYGLSQCKNNCLKCINNDLGEICLECKSNASDCFINYILPLAVNYLDNWVTKAGE